MTGSRGNKICPLLAPVIDAFEAFSLCDEVIVDVWGNKLFYFMLFCMYKPKCIFRPLSTSKTRSLIEKIRPPVEKIRPLVEKIRPLNKITNNSSLVLNWPKVVWLGLELRWYFFKNILVIQLFGLADLEKFLAPNRQ